MASESRAAGVLTLVAVATICTSLHLLYTESGTLHQRRAGIQPPNPVAAYVSALDAVRPMLPNDATVTFINRQADQHPMFYLTAAQYALAPTLLDTTARHAWMLVNGKGAPPIPSATPEEPWALVAAINDSVRVYQRRALP